MKVEIVVYNVDSAVQAQVGGADRIELCDNPGEGGTTPSAGILERVRKKLTIQIFVMIRPRGGDFLYSEDEFASMKLDIELCKKLKADGVVFGILKADGSIDKERCTELIALARPMKVTCHRAFDVTRDPLHALEDCIEVGFDRILTSGQQNKAIQGIDLVAQLVKKSNGRIIIMPGSGVNEETVGEIVSKTGAEEIHFSAFTSSESRMQYRNSNVHMGSEKDSEFKLRTVDPSRVRKIREIAERGR